MDPTEESRQRTLDAMAEVREAVEAGEHIGKQLQMRDVHESDDTLIVEMPVGAHLRNTRGGLQGGMVATLVDMTAGRLAMAGVDEGHSTATIDLNIHFLLPIVTGPARATATFVRRGTRTVVVRVDVEDVGRDRLTSTAIVQFVVLENLA